MELVGAREDRVEVVGQRVDLVGAHEALEEDPPVVTPGGNLGVGGSACGHGVPSFVSGENTAVTATVFSGGSILTMDAAASTADVVVTEGDRIVAVGAAALARRYPDAYRVELGGRTLVPGFIDAHSHLCIAALHPRWADLAVARDSDALLEALRAQAAAEPGASWVRGVGWSDLEDAFTPTRDDLDALGIDRPVIAVHYSYHQCVVSSAALDALGISETTPDPPGGSFGRTPSGALNGVLYERAFSEAHARSMAPYRDPDCWAEHIETAANSLLAEGVTCVHDAACPPSAEVTYAALARTGRLPISVLMMPHAEALLSPLDTTRLDGPRTGEGDARLRVGAVKLFADGGVLPAIEGQIHGHAISLGMVFEDLEAQVAAVIGHGFRVAVHAIGNRGAETTLDAFAAAASAHPVDEHRFRMEHATLLSGGQATRLEELGAVAVVQPGFLHHMGGAVDGFELDDSTWMPFADLAAAGVVLAGSSDTPCAFREPLLTSALGVTRRTSKGTVLDARQSLPYEDWLRAYTAGAAFAGGQEDERGRLATGLQADFAVLDGPLNADNPPTVAETWVAGTRVFVRSDAVAG
jgi:predicted amidohydrolase YtcJ